MGKGYSFLLLVLSALVVVSSNGCATRDVLLRTVYSDQIAEYGQYPGGLDAFFRTGHTIELSAKTELNLLGRKLQRVKMVVLESDSEKITGRVVDTCCGPALDGSEFGKQRISVNLDEIESIRVWKKEYENSAVMVGVVVIIVVLAGGQACGENPGECFGSLFP